jgi:hypothetical protein
MVGQEGAAEPVGGQGAGGGTEGQISPRAATAATPSVCTGRRTSIDALQVKPSLNSSPTAQSTREASFR